MTFSSLLMSWQLKSVILLAQQQARHFNKTSFFFFIYRIPGLNNNFWS